MYWRVMVAAYLSIQVEQVAAVHCIIHTPTPLSLVLQGAGKHACRLADTDKASMQWEYLTYCLHRKGMGTRCRSCSGYTMSCSVPALICCKALSHSLTHSLTWSIRSPVYSPMNSSLAAPPSRNAPNPATCGEQVDVQAGGNIDGILDLVGCTALGM